MLLHVSSTVVLIITMSKLYYTASGIVTLKNKYPNPQVTTAHLNIIFS